MLYLLADAIFVEIAVEFMVELWTGSGLVWFCVSNTDEMAVCPLISDLVVCVKCH